MLLGQLVELVLHDGRKMSASKLRGTFLAWMPSSNNFAVVTRAKAAPGALSAKSREVFRRFHKTETKKAAAYDWPTPSSKTQVGRLKSLTYVVPQAVKSPEKHGFRWVHEFGDHGERGHGQHDGFKGYPTHLMPMLLRGNDGSIHIKRMPGNKYDVTEWIYW